MNDENQSINVFLPYVIRTIEKLPPSSDYCTKLFYTDILELSK